MHICTSIDHFFSLMFSLSLFPFRSSIPLPHFRFSHFLSVHLDLILSLYQYYFFSIFHLFLPFAFPSRSLFSSLFIYIIFQRFFYHFFLHFSLSFHFFYLFFLSFTFPLSLSFLALPISLLVTLLCSSTSSLPLSPFWSPHSSPLISLPFLTLSSCQHISLTFLPPFSHCHSPFLPPPPLSFPPHLRSLSTILSQLLFLISFALNQMSDVYSRLP